MLKNAKEGGIFLLTTTHSRHEVWDTMPIEVQQQIIDKKLKFYCINAIKYAQEIGLGARINVIMQTAFFKITNIIPVDQAIESIKGAIKKSYGSKGEKVVNMNFAAIEAGLNHVEEVEVPQKPTSCFHKPETVSANAPEFVREVTATIMKGEGDTVPVGKMPCDGKFPTGTTKYEKRNIAVEIPEWDPKLCIQCGQCSLVCPHATIRIKAYDEKYTKDTPATFKWADAKGKDLAGLKFTVQVAPEDCTGCGACVDNCPAKERDENKEPTGRKAINMADQEKLRLTERENYEHFLNIPNTDPAKYKRESIKGSQFIEPLFEYSGACAGCGETAYVKLLTQFYGDRAMIANATGCSSIYGGNLPTTPYCQRKEDGRGPTWSNSLFEDNAEFGMGMRLATDKFKEFALELLEKAGESKCVEKGLADEILASSKKPDKSQDELEVLRGKVEQLKSSLKKGSCAICDQLITVADYLVDKSVWIVGGDGWAYDIGYGGLDHVLASGKNVNVLVLDTEVYSNTGGQMSKATPKGAIAKFAAGGKPISKKDLGMISMTYGDIYVAKIAMGANPNQAVKAFAEAGSYNGPSLIIAYAHCIAHGINMTTALNNQKRAVDCGAWPLYRFDPRLKAQCKNPLQMDSKEPSIPYTEYAFAENRFRALKSQNPEVADKLAKEAEAEIKAKYAMMQEIAKIQCNCGEK